MHFFVYALFSPFVRVIRSFIAPLNAISFRRSIGIFAQHRMQDREIDDNAARATAAAAAQSVMM